MNAHPRYGLSSFVIALAAMLLLHHALTGVVQAQPLLPQAPLACSDGDQPSGAVYRICMPSANWNGDLVIYAHGYVKPSAPIAIPEDQLVIGGFPIADLITAQGFAFATSSYRRNGLSILEGVDDLLELVDIFAAQHGQPDRIILTGVSEGGAITVLALERHPDVFDGGMALCGPYGNFQRQIDYFTDFRAVFDFYFPGVIAGGPISIPVALVDDWETTFYSETVKPLLLSPTSVVSMSQVISVTGAAVLNVNTAAGMEPTFDRLLWYNVQATNDAREHLGGNPFGNVDRVYTGSLDDDALNQGVFRATADAIATDEIAMNYETSGVLRVPLITLHTTGDEVAPYWQAALYAQKVAAAGSGAFYEHRSVNRFGHCAFQSWEVLDAFDYIVARANARSLYLPWIAAQ
ncbi:prolyl oligopeptidase family serine peptidase [Caldilinea sp.]|uniref:alpha/beta hydrolase family protein n=1 Tax=Caldilinea sp. TaxID=2293560 RepID=UPI002BBBDABD|nr:prolyl oligopeptidase family serine peptidase [Caldilinea sp.]